MPKPLEMAERLRKLPPYLFAEIDKKKKAALEVTPQQALRTMRAIMLAHKSSRERRTVEWDEPAE